MGNWDALGTGLAEVQKLAVLYSQACTARVECSFFEPSRYQPDLGLHGGECKWINYLSTGQHLSASGMESTRHVKRPGVAWLLCTRLRAQVLKIIRYVAKLIIAQRATKGERRDKLKALEAALGSFRCSPQP